MTCYILVMWSFSSRPHSMVMDPEMLARLVFCFENNPERHDGIISGAQDSIGICVPGLMPFLIISSLFFMWGFAHGILEVLNPHF